MHGRTNRIMSAIDTAISGPSNWYFPAQDHKGGVRVMQNFVKKVPTHEPFTNRTGLITPPTISNNVYFLFACLHF